MKRLLEVVRDEQGDLSLRVVDTCIGMYMSTHFWKELIKELEKPIDGEEFFEPSSLTKRAKIIQILKEGIEG